MRVIMGVLVAFLLACIVMIPVSCQRESNCRTAGGEEINGKCYKIDADRINP